MATTRARAIPDAKPAVKTKTSAKVRSGSGSGSGRSQTKAKTTNKNKITDKSINKAEGKTTARAKTQKGQRSSSATKTTTPAKARGEPKTLARRGAPAEAKSAKKPSTKLKTGAKAATESKVGARTAIKIKKQADGGANPSVRRVQKATAGSVPTGSARFYNRELSWLQFNKRVLEEAQNKKHPLLERLRFLSISASNLDEFYMVRAAGLYGQVAVDVKELSADGKTPQQQLNAINAVTADLVAEKSKLWDELKRELQTAGIHIVSPDELAPAERRWLEDLFFAHLFPVLTPLNVDPSHPFPFVQNKGLTLVVEMLGSDDKAMTGLIPIPPQLERFMRLPTEGKGNRDIRFIAIETAIGLFLSEFFPSFTIRDHGIFRIIRDSDIEYQEEAEDLTAAYEALLRRRRRGSAIRLEIDGHMNSSLRQFVIDQLDVREEAIFIKNSIVGLADVSKLVVDDRPELLFPPFTARFPERVEELGGDVFAAIKAKDFVVHHPYESFEVVLRYLRQSVQDPNVLAIKWTLYRTSREDSPIVEALKEAADLGKSVTAVVELKARFDESANINLARELEKAGVHVIYGFQQLKTHAKLGMIVRKEGQHTATYCHIGTGNYHPQTARIYTDLSYFTDDAAISRDVAKIFNFVTGYGKPSNFEKMAASPHGIRSRIVEHIDKEIAHAKAGRPAAIWFKMNALVDPDIIDKLYGASSAGVQIDLVIRGICCLRPGILGLSENIRVKSIVGRFLEHSRIYCFGQGHGLPSSKAAVYISSADMMQRNLDRRVEAMVPIVNATVHEQIVDQVMGANLRDNQQSWQILADGSHRRFLPTTDEPTFNAHAYFMTNPSLSGRGQALEQHKPPRIRIRRRQVKKLD
ncbi:MAG: RNA degradosome polyphosphate kinase [Hyphomicrobiaceae bacterium]